MKPTILTLIILLSFTGVFARQTDTVKVTTKTDTVLIKTTHEGNKKKSVTISLGKGKNGHTEEFAEGKKSGRPGFSMSFTASRIDLGLAKLVDHGSFTLSSPNQFLANDASKTSNFGLDLLQFGYRFTSAFKIYVAAGADWTHIRLKKDITILPNQPVLTYSVDAVEYEKNRFSSTYLRIPFMFDIRSKDDDKGNKFHLVLGPEVGFLMNGKVKQKINGEKTKVKDDYHFTQFRYGAVARIGYGSMGLYVKKYFNDTFENSPAQDGLKNMAFGVMLGF